MLHSHPAQRRPGFPLVALLLLATAVGCAERQAPPAGGGGADAQGHTLATPATAEANAAVATSLPLGDRQDFDDVAHGRVAGDSNVVIADAKGRAIWDTRRYGFVQGDAPPTVNPTGRPRGVRR